MKHRRTLSLALLALLALAPLPSRADDAKDSPLEIEMKGMNNDFKQLKKQVADPAQKASSLDLIASMKKHAKAARELTPDNEAKVPKEDQAKWMDAYKQEMDKLLGQFDKLDAAVSGDHLDEAKALLPDILATKREGHEQFNKEEKK